MSSRYWLRLGAEAGRDPLVRVGLLAELPRYERGEILLLYSAVNGAQGGI